MAITVMQACPFTGMTQLPLPEVQSYESIFDYLLTVPEVDFLDACIRISSAVPDQLNPLFSGFAS